MKHLLMAVGLAAYGLAFAQTDQANLEKYWKFRNSFREKFVKIGPLVGESLPAGRLKPHDCVDNLDSLIDGTPFSGTKYGEMHWGDGMIRHGHYLGLLATEYALLKRSGQDVTGVQNELYYALEAINRLDRNAEINQKEFYGLTLNADLNGFYNREDIREDFASDNWGTDPMKMRCVNSAFYKNNNAGKENASGWYNEGNTYQNVPSMDQMSSLLVGLRLVYKLAETGIVQPDPSKPGQQLHYMARDIMYRIIKYPAQRNWFILDVNGWPVANGGGELILMASAMNASLAKVGLNGFSPTAYRKIPGYQKVQLAMTGYGKSKSGPVEQQNALNSLNIIQQNTMFQIQQTQGCVMQGGYPFPLSQFSKWQYCGLQINTDVTQSLWQNHIPNSWPNIYQDWAEDHKFNNTFSNGLSIGMIEFDNLNISDYNNTIMFNMGVASGWWSGVQASTWAGFTGNRSLELINAVINSKTPIHTVSFYKTFLDSLSITGPYHLKAGYWTGDSLVNMHNKYHSQGWASEYRWTHPHEATGETEQIGIYSALDYMLYHNLYMLLFKDPANSPFEEKYSCQCTNAPQVSTTSTDPKDIDAVNNLNSKLNQLETCPDVFVPVNNLVTGDFTVGNKFNNYEDLGIFVTKVMARNTTIKPTGNVHVRTNFIICNAKELYIEGGGNLNIEKKTTTIKPDAKITVDGTLRIKSGSQLVISDVGKLTLNANSKIIVEDNARLIIDFGGILEYYSGAQIITQGENNEIIMRGTVKIMNTATFKIDHSADGHSGRFLMAGGTFLAMQPNTKIDLKGKGITDEFVVLPDNGKIWVQSQNISSFRIDKCKVRLGENAYIKAEQPFYSTEVDYYAVKDNLGITVTDLNQFNYCNFTDVFVDARLNIEQVSKFNAYRCNFTRNDFALINYIPTLRVEGMGFVLNHCTFTNGLPRSIEAKNMTVPSGIYNSVFEQQYGVLPLIFHGISDESNTEIVIQNSTFTGFGTAIVKSSGKLSLRCNTFISNSRTNVEVKNGCMLNISTADYAGYNYFHTAGDQSIKLTSGNINLNNGYNYISENSPKAIQGSLSYACTNCVIAARKNQWNAANTTPGPNKFSLLSSNGNVIGMSYPAPTVVPACGYEDQGPVPGDPGGGVAGKAGGAPGDLPMVYIFGDSLPLDQAIAYGRNKMEIHDSLGNDLEAITVFDGIFSSDILKSDSIAGPLLRYALTSMKTAVENAISNGKISKANNAGGFEQHVAMYVQALMYLTDSVITSDNYVSQYYHELDKAHLFRVIGHADIGLDLLTALEDCGLDSAQQAQLNYWKTEYAKDLVVEQIGLETLDTLIAIDTLGYTQPQPLQFNKYHFGAKINSLFDIVYPNCDFYSLRTARTENGPAIILFPNPAAEVVYIQFNHPSESGISLLTFQGADGRQVFGATFTGTGQSRQSVDVSEWKPGMYLYKYVSPSGKAFTGKLVVE